MHARTASCQVFLKKEFAGRVSMGSATSCLCSTQFNFSRSFAMLLSIWIFCHHSNDIVRIFCSLNVHAVQVSRGSSGGRTDEECWR